MDKKTIFIAKDDKEMAVLIELILLHEGYHVISVSAEGDYTAFIEESLRRYEQEKNRVDLIINGFNLNGCLEHYSSFCRIKPDCKMIILTADRNNIEQVRQNPLEYERIVACIPLPFDVKKFLATVKNALAS